MKDIKVPTSMNEVFQGFEELKQTNDDDVECWSARDLQQPLGYNSWQKFDNVIQRAKNACESTNIEVSDHFVQSDKMVPIGSGAERVVEDFHMTRLGCYLTTMNGDSRKPEIGLAQIYFAGRTRRDELNDQEGQDGDRLVERVGYRNDHKRLSIDANNSGVANRNLGLFHDSGQRSMQGGYSVSELKERKGLPANANYPDHMSETELLANRFRMHLTSRHLSDGTVKTEKEAIDAHIQYGAIVRSALAYKNGLMPEDMPVLETTQQVVDRLKHIDVK